MAYYACSVVGLMDMRPVHGPFENYADALREARKIASEESHLEPARKGLKIRGNVMMIGYKGPQYIDGAWYCLHPADYYVSGPFETAKKAEKERVRFVSSGSEFECDAGTDLGLIAQAVEVIGTAAVVVAKNA